MNNKVKQYEASRIKPRGPLFYDASEWPELSYLEENYVKIREEVLAILDDFIYVGDMPHPLHGFVDEDGNTYDDRDLQNKWKFMDFKLDNNLSYGTPIELYSDKLSFTIQALKDLGKNNPELYPMFGLSMVEAGGIIGEHTHDSALSVILPLKCEHPTYLKVNDEKKYLEEGKFTIFNFGYKHSLFNESKTDRLALLLIFKGSEYSLKKKFTSPKPTKIKEI